MLRRHHRYARVGGLLVAGLVLGLGCASSGSGDDARGGDSDDVQQGGSSASLEPSEMPPVQEPDDGTVPPSSPQGTAPAGETGEEPQTPRPCDEIVCEGGTEPRQVASGGGAGGQCICAHELGAR